MEYPSFEYDVLVIGAGGAGLRAAIEAAATGDSVGLVCKSLLGKAHTVTAQSGMAAAMGHLDDRDDWKCHFSDIIRSGQSLNSWRMAELLARQAPDRVRELEAWGAAFDRTETGRIVQRAGAGHRYRRLAQVGDRTGLEIIRTLQDHGSHQGIDVHMECTAVELLLDGGRAAGALAYDRKSGRLRIFKSKATVLASGGFGRAYATTSNSWESTGDGHALAYRAGAELMDMEFVQFHPTGMVWPPSIGGIVVSEAARGDGGVLRNSEGTRFMFDAIPDRYRHLTAEDEEEAWSYVRGDLRARWPPELLPRDHVARCIAQELREGRGGPHGGVFLDLAQLETGVADAARHLEKRFPGLVRQCRQRAGVDITKTPIEVGPTTHYVMGGIRVDPDTQISTVPGLFAAGECAAGPHGANRLGGNSLSDQLVFGKLAGEHAVRFARQHGDVNVDPAQVSSIAGVVQEPFDRAPIDEGVYQLQHELQDVMQSMVGVVRTGPELDEALAALHRLQERAKRVRVEGSREFNPGWHTSLDLRNLLLVAEAVTRAAIERTESRGAHYREDYIDSDPDWGTVNVVTQRGDDGSMQVRRQHIPPLRPDLRAIVSAPRESG